MWCVAIFTVLVVSVLVLTRRRLVVVEVSGESMTPTYRSGDRVLVRRVHGSAVGRGQVVVFEKALAGAWHAGQLSALKDAEWRIKRVVALPGDVVPPEVVRAVGAVDGALVPDGRLVVVGDGSSSADSRHWGYLPADRVLGVVVRRLSLSSPVGTGS